MPGIKNLDTRQAKFLSLYLDPKSKTFNNALQSALKAGFSRNYANQITTAGTEWMTEAHGKRLKMLEKAERNLDEALDVDITEQAMGAFGPIFDKKTKKPVMKRNVEIMKLKHDASKFVAKTVGKEHYSENPNVLNDNRSINLTISDDKLSAIIRREASHIKKSSD